MRRTASEKVYEKLKEQILADAFMIGEKLPTEQSLCETYGVGRSTVREAQRILQAKGLVEIRRGSGAYVISKNEAGLADETQWLKNNRESLQDYMEVRTAIEVLAARQLLSRPNASLEALQQIQDRFEQAVRTNDVIMMSAMDNAFHEAIADSTENVMLSSINKLIQKEFSTYRRITFEQLDTRNDAVSAHRKILEALARRDTDAAVYAVREHLQVSMENAIDGMEE